MKFVTIVGEMMRGGDCKQKADCQKNVHFFMTTKGAGMLLSLAEQYMELHHATLLQFTATPTPTTIVLPKHHENHNFAPFCVPEASVCGAFRHVIMPVMQPNEDGVLVRRPFTEYRDMWLPIVNSDGVVKTCVLTTSDHRDWPAYRFETSFSPIQSLPANNVLLLMDFLGTFDCPRWRDSLGTSDQDPVSMELYQLCNQSKDVKSMVCTSRRMKQHMVLIF